MLLAETFNHKAQPAIISHRCYAFLMSHSVFVGGPALELGDRKLEATQTLVAQMFVAGEAATCKRAMFS